MLQELGSTLFQFVSVHATEAHLIVVGLIIAYYLVIYPFILSPLRDVPGPYLHRISRFSALNNQRTMTWVRKVDDLHKKYGNVVLLSPIEVSVNGEYKYLHDLYTKNLPKSKFYENFRNHGFKDNIFASLENDRHIKYKKIVSNIYSKSSIFSKSNTARLNIVEKITNLVKAVYKSSVDATEPDYINARSERNIHGKGYKNSDWFNKSGREKNLGIDVYSLFGSLACDVVSGFELGIENGTDLISRPEERHILVSHREVASMVFWTTLMPRFWDWVAGKRILKAMETITRWQLNLYYNAETNSPKVIEGQNLTTLQTLNKAGLKGEYAYSFLTDNIFAGHETTAIFLTYLCYEISRPINSFMQVKLKEELKSTFGTPPNRQTIIDDFETVDTLPYLNALINEVGRVHTPIPGAEPRLVDKPYLVTAGNGKNITIPKGTIISSQPFSMHRLENVFPDPNRFIPERWLKYEDESESQFNQRIMKQSKFSMPFGKGIRMCLGMNIALIEMKLAVANLYWKLSSQIDNDWCDITQYDSESANKVIANVIETGFDFVGNNQTDEEKMVMYDSYTTRPYNDECWLRWIDDSDSDSDLHT
ncbi:cytochrome P450 [Scheffersomyces amazonensis]|uniref:cytochrome P450 n=1 Tax=Scheffersomyces amazonensis TaxID=1078765 RepID=UPI00315CBF18